MSVQDNNPVNASYTNSKLASKDDDNTLAGKQALEHNNLVSGANIADVQKAINDILAILAAGGGGDTMSNLGTGVGSFDSKVAGDFRLRSLKGIGQLTVVLNGQEIEFTGNFVDKINNETVGGEKTFTDKAIFNNGVEIFGTVTKSDTNELEVKDAYITINKGGSDATAENGGVEIERVGTNAAIQFDSSLFTKFKMGLTGDLNEVAVTIRDTKANLDALPVKNEGVKYYATDETIHYFWDGSNLINHAVSGTNVGTGEEVFKQKSGKAFQFRKLFASTNMSITQVGDSLHFASTASGVQHNFAAVVAPAVTDDSSGGYVVGSRWVDTATDLHYVCVDASVGAAVWKDTTIAGGGGEPNALHDNVANEFGTIPVQKVTPVTADRVLIEDSADSFNKKWVEAGDLPGGSDLEGQDEGITVDTAITKINVTGTGATLSQTSPGCVELNIPGPPAPPQIDVLVVGGGGGGGLYGGGGGGGFSKTLSKPISLATPYNVTIGAGGNGGKLVTNSSTPGSNSIYDDITELGGLNGRNASAGNPLFYNGGASASGQAGGSGGESNPWYGGGGGGDTQVGYPGGNSSPGNNNGGGDGGDGSTDSITGSPVNYAGGGGGGIESSGAGDRGTNTFGGGSGSKGVTGSSAVGTAGTPNTGGGGGGGSGGNPGPSGAAGPSRYGMDGGSGVVIIKVVDTISAVFSGGLTVSTVNSGGFDIHSVTAGTGTVTFN